MPATEITVKFEAALKDPKPLLERLGIQVANVSRRSFHEQRLGDALWEPRYPSQSPPYLNIAGALSDFAAGKSQPKPNRFQNRPALVDEGMRGGLQASITYSVVSRDTVQIGSNKPYANKMQYGGETTIALDKAAVQRAYDWLYTRKGKVRKGKERHAERLAFLFDQDRPWDEQGGADYTVKNIPRPFIGVTPELEADLVRTVKDYFERAQE